MNEQTGYLVRRQNGQYLERRPYDHTWTWDGDIPHATVVDLSLAFALCARFSAAGDIVEFVEDPLFRNPQETVISAQDVA